ncbi:hypothetical protein VTK73DRAFT_3714 [Phialemonium thermophilum]|uniref:GPI inositol-deacylase n=1 Tax=Phialemonium thermophilum TaxID=223376 RepID=A0ABR3WXK8_9PEZI
MPENSPSFFRRVLSSRSTPPPEHGALGLTTLFTPPEPQIEYVFVHGLGGGSIRTWCAEPGPSFFWPQAWLPYHADFQDVRIHTFGYDSKWRGKGTSTVDIHDFGQELLLAMRNSSCFATNPIVFVTHSMGGIVAKEAYVMARQDPACHELAARIMAMVFLATPHRGSDLAATLNRMLRLSAVHRRRPYVSSLERCSTGSVKINDAFRHYSNDLILYSYFETQELSLGMAGTGLIVQKDSAVLGLPGERVSMMNADHRSICKFQSPRDPNYIILTEALVAINREILQKQLSSNRKGLQDVLRQIESFLGVPETPEDDLTDLRDIRMPDSCSWFTDRPQFRGWIWSAANTGPNVFWLVAQPATGKSVLASHVIDVVKELSRNCSYYFFRHGDNVRSTLAGCLRSVAYQMAVSDEVVRGRILTLVDRGVRLEHRNAKSIWRKVLEPFFLDTTKLPPQIWVIDALDECSDVTTFFDILLKLGPSTPLKIFVTSRRIDEIAAGFEQVACNGPTGLFTASEMQPEDTSDSIRIYLDRNKQRLHVNTDQQRELLLERILERSQGCFLWVRLVLDELSSIWTMKQVEQVLEDVPQEMDQLYSRIVQLVSRQPAHSVEIARCILTWTICAIRPMTVAELQSALQQDVGTTLQDPEQAIASLCSQLVHVDKNGRVLMVHLTARAFLGNRGLHCPLAICPIVGHRRIAAVCLQVLVADEMKPLPSRRTHHARRKSRPPPELVIHDNLQVLTRTANQMENYYQRQRKYFEPPAQEVQLSSSWSVDLHRLVGKFSAHLVRQPDSIYSLIPPFCPRASAIATVFGGPRSCLRIVGLRESQWDSRVTCIDCHDSWAFAVAAGEDYFAVGFGNSVVLYHALTCQEQRRLDHGNAIHQLGFDSTGSLLVSNGRRDVKVWRLEDYTVRSQIDLEGYHAMAFSIDSEKDELLVVLRDHSIARYSLENGNMVSAAQWESTFPGEGGSGRPSPMRAALGPKDSFVAVAYHGRPVMIWSIEAEELCGLVGREREDLDRFPQGGTSFPVSMVFNPDESTPLLAVAYEDGDLCLFNYERLELVKTVQEHAFVLACSHDGALLATGSITGTVQLLEFETLRLLFRVQVTDSHIQSLAFSADDSRLLDVRGTQCDVWEPVLPLAKSRLGGKSSTQEDQNATVLGQPFEGPEIESLVVADSEWFFVGKSDGSVWLYRTTDVQAERLLYRGDSQSAVLALVWGSSKNILVSADVAGRFIVSLLQRGDRGQLVGPNRLLDVRQDVSEGAAIWRILLDESENLLLVSTMRSDTVWKIDEGKAISSSHFTFRLPFDWANNPVNESQRILIDGQGVSLWDWETCQLLVASSDLAVPRSLRVTDCESVVSVPAALASRGMVVQHSRYGLGNPAITVHLLDPKEFVAGTTISSSAAFGNAIADLLHLIGSCDSRFVFLNKDLWVCSLRMLDGPRPGVQLTRHFFLPADWAKDPRSLRTAITKRGDILFVKGGEVAVIKHWLTIGGDERQFLEPREI